MTHRSFIAFVLAFPAFWIVASGGTAQAQGQVYVLESTATSVKVGTSYAMSDRITVPAGASVRVVTPSGKTQMIKGPYSGVAADLAKGQKTNDGVVAWIKTLMQTGGSHEKTPGATRSARAPEQPVAFSWTAIPVTANSTICVEKGAKLQLRRASSPNADRVTVVDLVTTERGEATFAAGSDTVP